MKNNFPKIQFFTSLAFFVFSCALFFYFYQAIHSFNEKTQVSDTTWRAESVRREEIKTLDQSIKDITDERAALDTHFAKSSDVVPFLNTIEGLGPKVGAVASISSVNVPDDKSGLVVDVKATGSFASIYKFINLLENSPYELQFLGMDLNQSTTASSWDATFQIRLLSFIN